MRIRTLLAGVVAFTIVITGVWAVSASVATSAVDGARRSATIDAHELHLKADVAKLPVQAIEDIN